MSLNDCYISSLFTIIYVLFWKELLFRKEIKIERDNVSEVLALSNLCTYLKQWQINVCGEVHAQEAS